MPTSKSKYAVPNKKPFNEKVSGGVYRLMCQYLRHWGTLPNRNSLWKNVVSPKIPMSRTRFRTIWRDLVDMSLIGIDPQTGAVYIANAEVSIYETDDVTPDFIQGI